MTSLAYLGSAHDADVYLYFSHVIDDRELRRRTIDRRRRLARENIHSSINKRAARDVTRRLPERTIEDFRGRCVSPELYAALSLTLPAE